MKIGIDARFYGEAGPGRYVKNIILHLEKLDDNNSYVVFLRKKGFDMYTPHNPNFSKVLADYKWYTFDEQIRFLFVLLRQNLDLLYVPHFNIPVLYPKKMVTAIADLIMHQFSTEEATTLPLFYFKFKKWVYYWVMLWAVVRSKKVIVPSNDVINDFKKVYPFVPESKFVLAYEGVDPDFAGTDILAGDVLSKFKIQKPFLLYVSSMYPHKNVSKLIEMFVILKEKFNFEGNMVLIGKKDAYSQKYCEEIKNKGLADDILMPGQTNYVTDKEIVALRKNAAVYVFPSLKEGFSLTPLEGMAVGLVSAISDIPCHREIYGDSVLYFDPHNPADMAEKVNMLLINDNLRSELVSKANTLVKKYNWNDTAKTTLKVFEDAK